MLPRPRRRRRRRRRHSRRHLKWTLIWILLLNRPGSLLCHSMTSENGTDKVSPNRRQNRRRIVMMTFQEKTLQYQSKIVSYSKTILQLLDIALFPPRSCEEKQIRRSNMGMRRKEGRTFNCSMLKVQLMCFFFARVQHQSVLNISSFWCILLKLSFLLRLLEHCAFS